MINCWALRRCRTIAGSDPELLAGLRDRRRRVPPEDEASPLLGEEATVLPEDDATAEAPARSPVGLVDGSLAPPPQPLAATA